MFYSLFSLRRLISFRITDQFRNQNRNDNGQIDVSILANPVNAYLTIKGLTETWAAAESLMKANSAESISPIK